MSFLDPQSWTDIDGGGNALTWGSRTNKLLFPAYEMLRKALVERCYAADVAIPADLQDANKRAPDRIYVDDWKGQFDSTIDLLIPEFIDHRDSGGDWDGDATLPPAWTEANILAAIGEARISAPGIFLAEWSLQQYKLLNLLRWRKFRGPVDVGFQSEQARGWGYNVGATWAIAWANAVVAYNVDAYGALAPPGNGPWNWSRGDKLRMGGVTSASANRYRSNLTMGLIPVPATLEFTADWYIFINGQQHGFDAEGLPITEDRWWKFQVADGPFAGGATAISDYPPVPVGAPPEPPDPEAPPATQQSVIGWFSGSGVAGGADNAVIVKWDGANGFKFK